MVLQGISKNTMVHVQTPWRYHSTFCNWNHCTKLYLHDTSRSITKVLQLHRIQKHGITTVHLLHICKWSQYWSKPHFSVLLPVVSEEQVQWYVTGEKGGNTTLQCLDQPVNASSLLYRWKKNGAVVANPLKPSEHLSISNNGSLWISGLQYIDEGQYECESQTKDGSSWQTLSNTLLRVAGMVLWISKSY